MAGCMWRLRRRTLCWSDWQELRAAVFLCICFCAYVLNMHGPTLCWSSDPLSVFKRRGWADFGACEALTLLCAEMYATLLLPAAMQMDSENL